jgi:hypothetical protein
MTVLPGIVLGNVDSDSHVPAVTCAVYWTVAFVDVVTVIGRDAGVWVPSWNPMVVLVGFTTRLLAPPPPIVKWTGTVTAPPLADVNVTVPTATPEVRPWVFAVTITDEPVLPLAGATLSHTGKFGDSLSTAAVKVVAAPVLLI